MSLWALGLPGSTSGSCGSWGQMGAAAGPPDALGHLSTLVARSAASVARDLQGPTEPGGTWAYSHSTPRPTRTDGFCSRLPVPGPRRGNPLTAHHPLALLARFWAPCKGWNWRLAQASQGLATRLPPWPVGRERPSRIPPLLPHSQRRLSAPASHQAPPGTLAARRSRARQGPCLPAGDQL